MSFLSPHKLWIMTSVFAVALMFFSSPLLVFLRGKAARHLAEVQEDRTKTQQVLQRLDDDIATTQKLSGQIGADEIEKPLAPIDRLQASGLLERQADAARLDHFTYTLSPEQKVAINSTEMGAQELAVSTIAVKAEVPLDTDVNAFVQRVGSLMPGRLRLQSLTLEHTATAGTPPAADNLHMIANFEWLSNGVTKELAEGK